MKTISLEELLEAGCHFGHQVTRQNPKAKDYIFEARDGIHIIDLEKTKEGLEDAARFVKELAKKGGTLLVLGTKRQADALLREEIKRVTTVDPEGIHFITKRWIGGTLTNYPEVSKNFKRLKDLTARLEDDYEKSKYTKKEIGEWEKEKQKLLGFYGGAANMSKTPDALFIIDTHLERVAAHEATRMDIPTVGITDTNADPTIIDYPIPANDDAVGSLKLIISYVLDAWLEGREQFKKGVKEEKDAKEKKEEPKKETAPIAASSAIKKEEPKKEEPKKEVKKVAPKKEAAKESKTASKKETKK